MHDIERPELATDLPPPAAEPDDAPTCELCKRPRMVEDGEGHRCWWCGHTQR